MKSVVPSWLFLLLLLSLLLFGNATPLFAVSVSVAWDPSTDPDVNGYNLYYGEVGGTSTNQLPLGVVTTGTVNGLTVGKTYFAYVTAKSNSGGESDPSNYLTYAPSSTAQLQMTSMADQTIASGTQLQLTLSASEPGVSGVVFSYSVVSAPAGVAVDSTSGLLTWTPTSAQAPSTNNITVQVFDNSSPPLSASTSFKVVVTKGNSAPSLTGIAGQSFSSAASTPLLTNGSFESSYTGWTMSGNQKIDNSAHTDGAVAVRFNYGQLPPDGILSQTFSTVPGQLYSLNFDLGAFSLANQNEQRMAVTVQGNSTLVSKNFSVYAPGTGTSWSPQSATFTADSATTVLTFQDVSPTTDSVDLWLDNVRVTGGSSGVLLTAVVGKTLSATITATDPDLPSQTLTYSLVSGPAGVAVNATTGVLTWTPTLAQSQQTYPVTVKVSDNGSPSLSDSETFNIYVPAVNTPPVLNTVPNLLASVGTLLTWTLSATDAETPASGLTYQLVSGGSGATVNPTTGLFSWTPAAAQAGTTVSFTVSVSDNGSPVLTDSQTFQVAVLAANTAPVLPPIATQTIPEGKLFSLALNAKDSDLPAQVLTYQLVSGPSGATVDPARGVFSWTPTEAQGPSSNQVTVRVADNGTPSMSDTETFTIVVQEVNRPPVFTPVPDQTIGAGQTLMLSLTATDPDIPANTLTYGLVSGPTGIKVDPTTGVLTWRLSKSIKPSTNSVTVVVSDNGSPSLSSTMTFSVIVSGKRNSSVQSPYLVTNLGSVSWLAEVAPGQQLRFTYALPVAKQTGQPVHYLEVSEDLVHWSTLGPISDLTELRDSDAMGTPMRFYRVRTETVEGSDPSASSQMSAN